MKKTIDFVSPREALRNIKSGDRVFVQGSAQTPTFLINELAKESSRLSDVELVSITLQGNIEISKPEYADSFRINSLFVSDSVREAINDGRGDFVPVFLSDIPDLFRSEIMPVDVSIVQVTPPDRHGYCSLGVSVDIARAAVSNSKRIIAQVNPNAPKTFGDGTIHIERIDAFVECDDQLPEVDYAAKIRAEDRMIGQYISEMIEDGSTLQLGIGSIPDAVLESLSDHKNLGIHTEMFSDGIIDLIETGVINNREKVIHPLKTVSGFAIGTKRLYDYVNANPSFFFLDIDFVNDPHIIRKNPKVVAINSAIEVDITGQVCADSIGSRQYSGIGGQMDFMRGAALSEGGKPIIAITARTRRGESRIVPYLKPGAGVVTTRGHVHYIVTDYGVAYLYGKNLRERARALINIAHPDDREELERACLERFKKFDF